MMLWQELKKQFRLFDGILIIGLIFLSFLPLVLFTLNEKNSQTSPDSALAIVSINGKEVDRYVLSPTTAHQEKMYYPKKKQYNLVEVDGQRIRVKEDNSPDQIAVNTGWISRPGETSICLPHRLVVEIKSMSADDEEDLIITY